MINYLINDYCAEISMIIVLIWLQNWLRFGELLINRGKEFHNLIEEGKKEIYKSLFSIVIV